jgi:VirK protein
MRRLNVLCLAAASCVWLLSGPAHQSAFAGDEPAPSQYTEVVNALQTTKPVRLLTDLGRCVNEGAGKHGPLLQGGLSINTFVVLRAAVCSSPMYIRPSTRKISPSRNTFATT